MQQDGAAAELHLRIPARAVQRELPEADPAAAEIELGSAGREARDLVIAPAGCGIDEVVRATQAVQHVITRAARQRIGKCAAEDGVIPTGADDGIGPRGVAADQVGLVIRMHHARAAREHDLFDMRLRGPAIDGHPGGVPALGFGLMRGDIGLQDDEMVVALAADGVAALRKTSRTISKFMTKNTLAVLLSMRFNSSINIEYGVIVFHALRSDCTCRYGLARCR